MQDRDFSGGSPTLARGGDLLARMSVRNAIRTVVVYLLVGAGAFVIMIPFAWMVSTAFKERTQTYSFPPVFIPNPVVFPDHFRTAIERMHFFNSLANTLIVSIGGATGVTFVSSLVAYGFARLRWPGRDKAFLLVIATMMLPGQVTMIPTFLLFSKLGWIDSFKPLIVPPWFGGAYQVFMLRQFFMTLSPELDDAARIDGCSRWGIFFRIVLPLAKSALITIFLLDFTGRWNWFMGPLIYLNTESKWVLAVALRRFQTQYRTYMNELMAGSILTVFPLIALFYAFQRVFIQGIVFTGIKG